MQETSYTWKRLWADGGKDLPSAEYGGSVVSFANPGYVYPRDLSVAIEPAQDLNGYDRPWPGGCGKNLFDEVAAVVYPRYFGTNSRWVVNMNAASYAFACQPDTTYAISAHNEAITTFQAAYIEDATIPNTGALTIYGRVSLDHSGSITLTTSANATYLVVYINNTIAYAKSAKLQIELGSAATAYSPYSNICPISGRTEANVVVSPTTTAGDGATYAVSWQSEAGTVYGGSLDVTTGLLTVTHGSKRFSEISTWEYQSESTLLRFRALNALTGIPANASRTLESLCSAYACKHNRETFSKKWNGIFYTVNDGLYVHDHRHTDVTTFLNEMGDTRIVYELAAPITYQLAPTEIALLTGTNNIWADAGEATVVLECPGDVRLESKAVIAGADHMEISNPVVSRALMQDGLSVGNAVSATCRFSMRTGATIPKSAEVAVKMRLTDGSTASEWLDAGTFYVSHRTRDAVTGLVTLECYDAMLKANADASVIESVYSARWVAAQAQADPGDPPALYPCAMADMAALIADVLGVELDSRNDLATGSGYVIDAPEAGASVHDILARIAAANGGNWIVTPKNRLRLVPVVVPLNTPSVNVIGVLRGITDGAAVSITGLRYTEDDVTTVVGSDAGAVVDVLSDVTAAQARAMAAWIIGRAHQSYALEGAVYDPAAELGDAVTRLNDVASVIESEVATLGPAFRGDLSAPESGELADEYPYMGRNERSLKSLRASVAGKASIAYVDAAETRANQVTAALNAALDQQGVFNRLTNNGQTQGIYLRDGLLYINGSYIDTGTLNANLIRAGMIADASGQNYWILDGNNSEFVTRKGIIGDFVIEDGALQYGSQAVGGTGAYIGRDGISYNTTGEEGGQNNLIKTSIFSQGLRFYWDNTLRTQMYIYNGGLHLRCYDDRDGVATYPIQVWDSYNVQNQLDQYIWVNYELRPRAGMYIYQGNLKVQNNVLVFGDFEVRGTKNRRVASDDYGERLLYSYETPSPMFGDVGEGVIGEDGRCHIWLDAVFAQTIVTDQYQVFLQKYGGGDCWIAERRAGCFVVQGTPGLAFGWEMKARQRGFDQRRLEKPIEAPERSKADFGAMALAHIEQIHEGRMDA